MIKMNGFDLSTALSCVEQSHYSILKNSFADI